MATLLWCAGMVTYLAIFGRPTTLSETIANGCLLLMASVIGSYVFGAVWEDIKLPGTADPYGAYPPADVNNPDDPEPPEGYAR